MSSRHLRLQTEEKLVFLPYHVLIGGTMHIGNTALGRNLLSRAPNSISNSDGR